MSIFVLLPDQLFHDKIDVVLACDSIYLVEEPKILVCRKLMRLHFQWLKSVGGKSVIYVTAGQIRAKGEDVFDYFVGLGKQVNMFWPAKPYLWEEKPRKYTYNGLHICFHETPAFVLTLSDDWGGLNMPAFIKKLMNRFTWPPGILPEMIIRAALSYDFGHRHLGRDLASFYDKYSTLRDAESARVMSAINVGILSPLAGLRWALEQADIGLIGGIFRREYERAKYLTNCRASTGGRRGQKCGNRRRKST